MREQRYRIAVIVKVETVFQGLFAEAFQTLLGLSGRSANWAHRPTSAPLFLDDCSRACLRPLEFRRYTHTCMRVIGRSAKGGMGSQFSCRRSELFADTIGSPPSCPASSQLPARFLPLPGDKPIFAELEWLGKLGKAESTPGTG